MRLTHRIAAAAFALFAAMLPAFAGDAASIDDIVKCLRASTDPQAVLDKAGGTVFTFGDAERDRLAKAGASPALIAALQKPRASLADVQNVALILDCSGSMKEIMPDGRTKMDAAKAVLTDMVKSIPAGLNVCFIIYGHDVALKCKAVKVVRPLASFADADRSGLMAAIAALRPTGHTPIALSLRTAGEQLMGAHGLCQVVLVTDGAETCHGDPAAEAEALALKLNLRGVDVIGLNVSGNERASVEKIARAALGKFLEARSALELAAGLRQVVKVEPEPEPEPELEPEVKLSAGVRALVEQLKDESAEVRFTAAEALESMGAKAKPAARYLADRIADDLFGGQLGRDGTAGKTSKDAAVKALRKHGPERVDGALARATRSKSPAAREWAAKAIGGYLATADGWHEPPASLKAVTVLLKDEYADVRGAAADALYALGPKAKYAASALAERVADDVWGSALSRDGSSGNTSKDVAVKALQKIAPDLVEGAVARALKSKSASVREWATKKVVELDK